MVEKGRLLLLQQRRSFGGGSDSEGLKDETKHKISGIKQNVQVLRKNQMNVLIPKELEVLRFYYGKVVK